VTRRVGRRPRICDVPRCAVEVPRGKLMCRDHWFALPRPLRAEINAAWREGRIRDWSANCLAARNFLATAADPAAQATGLRDRILGEHERTDA
jgi:hypothetical protein